MKFATYSENCTRAGAIAHKAEWPKDKDSPDYDWWTKASAKRYIRDTRAGSWSGPGGVYRIATARALAEYLK